MTIEAEKIDVGWVDPEYVSGHFTQSIAAAVRDMEYFGCMGGVIRHSAPQQNDARNAVALAFVEGENPWLWFVDADMMFDKGHVMKLWTAAQEHDAKIVSGLAMIWKEGHIPVPSIFYEDDEGLKLHHNRLRMESHEVAATGLASVLIHRDVFEALEPPRHEGRRWFDVIPDRELGLPSDGLAGVDVQFFVRARQAGFKHVVEPKAETTHLETIGVNLDTWERYWTPKHSGTA